MRYSFLNYAVCPRCRSDLTVATIVETECAMSGALLKSCERVSPAGAVVGPLGPSVARTPLYSILSQHAAASAPPERNSQVIVDTGLLICAECGAWFPIKKAIPELLPDHLRQWEQERGWFAEVSARLPTELATALREFEPKVRADEGAHYKLAEISLPAKVTDPLFFQPGTVSPFNFGWPEHTWHLIRNFVVVEPLLELVSGSVVLDAGSGYSWTTEWMLRGGYEPIGLDICRAYLEIALARVGTTRPHLLVADVENLPIRSESLNAVLGFEAFHHIPNRQAAMREFGRVLRDGRPVVLNEPGGAHEHADVSIEAMKKFGTLEKGMELDDVVSYANGSALGDCREHHVLRFVSSPAHPLNLHSDAPAPLLANRVYTLRKGAAADASPSPKRADRRIARALWSVYVRLMARADRRDRETPAAR